jgi:Ca2+/Na+ antiporter
MILINIAIFLSIAAIIIAFQKPKSKIAILLISLFVPIVLAFVVALIEASFSKSTLSYANKMAWSIGDSLISVIVSILTLFFCLKKKYAKLANGEQYKFPKGLIIAIIILLSLGLLSEWGIYNRKKTEQKIEVEALMTQEKARRLVKENVESTKKILPTTQAGFSFTDVYIKDNAFTAYFIIDDNEINFDDYINHIEKYKSEYFLQSTGNNQEFVNTMLLSGYDWTLILEAKNSGKKKELTLLAKELREIFNNK